MNHSAPIYHNTSILVFSLCYKDHVCFSLNLHPLSTSTKGYPLKACPEYLVLSLNQHHSQSLTSSFSQSFSPDESSLNPVSINSNVLDSVSIRLSSSSLINLPLLSRDTCLFVNFIPTAMCSQGCSLQDI